MAPRKFEESVLPHLDAAFNYARWLTRNDTDAEDVVQDACVRALRFSFAARRQRSRMAAVDCAQHVVQPVPGSVQAIERSSSTIPPTSGRAPISIRRRG